MAAMGAVFVGRWRQASKIGWSGLAAIRLLQRWRASDHEGPGEGGGATAAVLQGRRRDEVVVREEVNRPAGDLQSLNSMHLLHSTRRLHVYVQLLRWIGEVPEP